MVKMGHTHPPRAVSPSGPDVGDIEVNTVTGIRDRGGPHEFLTSQRLDFDLLVHVESGSAVHTVDFADHPLRPGDVLWVRAGQVHQWGEIADIEGTVADVRPARVDERTRDLIRSAVGPPSQATGPPPTWPEHPVAKALDLLTSAVPTRGDSAAERFAPSRPSPLPRRSSPSARARRADGQHAGTGPTHEAFTWFRDHIEEHFRSWHKVSEYAERLGYSTRTLNRLARQNTGLSAKELIDERVVLEAKRQLSHAAPRWPRSPSNLASMTRRTSPPTSADRSA